MIALVHSGWVEGPKGAGLDKGQGGLVPWMVVLITLLAVGVGIFFWIQRRTALGPQPAAPVEVVLLGTPYLKTDRLFDHVDLAIDGAPRAQWDNLSAGDHQLPADVAAAVKAAFDNRSTNLSIRVKATKDGVPYDFSMDMMPSRGRSRAIASSFSEPVPPPNAEKK